MIMTIENFDTIKIPVVPVFASYNKFCNNKNGDVHVVLISMATNLIISEYLTPLF